MALPTLALSQTHLTLFETCSRRFQYVFDQALAVPPTADSQNAVLWGNQFHLLMQQQALGLPVNLMTTANEDMVARVESLRQKAPHLFSPAPDERLRQSEHQRSLVFNGYLLRVIYDLVILTDDSGLIADWKTYLNPPQKARLANNWQTRLYLYVLAETSDLAPEQLTMVYWFVRHRDQQGNNLPPTAYRFTYGLQQHDQTRAALIKLTDRLSVLRQRGDFPQTDNLDICARCPFQIRCQRMDNSGSLSNVLIDIDAIEEISMT